MHPPYIFAIPGLLTSTAYGSHSLAVRSLASPLSAFLQTWLQQQGTLRSLHLLTPQRQQQQQQQQPVGRNYSIIQDTQHSRRSQRGFRMLQQFSNNPLQLQQQSYHVQPLQHFQQQQYRGIANRPTSGRFDRFRPNLPQQQQQHKPEPAKPQQRQQQQRHAGSGNPPDAALLTHNIMSSETPGDLVKLFVSSVQYINHIHVIAALSRAAALWDQTALPAAAAARRSSSSNAQQPVDIERQQLQQLLKHLAGPFTRSIQHYKGRELSTGLWAYARCNQPVPDNMLQTVTNHVTSWDVLTDNNTSTQHLVNLSWAVAHLGCTDRKMYAAIAAAALHKVQDLTASQVSVLAWTLAKAGYKDNMLITALADRAKLLLTQQQQTYQQQQQDANAPKPAAGKKKKFKKSDEYLRFKPGGLTGLAWAFGSTWRYPDLALLSSVAAVACQKPLVYDFKPQEAANLIKGLAIAAGMGDLEADHDVRSSLGSSCSSSSSSSSSSEDDAQGAAAGIPAAAAAAAAATDPTVDFWPAACTVATAALRRQEGAQASSFARIMWALAELYGRRRQQQHNKDLNPPAAAAAAAAAVAPAGSEVYEQLAAAVLKLWRHQEIKQQTLVITAWALAKAQQHGLIAPLLLLPPSSSSSSMPAVQQLFRQLCDVVIKAADQDLFEPYQLADLAAALTSLQHGIKVPAAAAGQQQRRLHNPSSSSSTSSNEVKSTAVDYSESDNLSQLVDQQLAQWNAAMATNAPNARDNASRLSAAVGAVFAAAERAAASSSSSGGDNAMRLVDAAKLMASAMRTKGHQHQDLLQQLLQRCRKMNLHEADNETLLLLTKVLVTLARQQPQIISDQTIICSRSITEIQPARDQDSNLINGDVVDCDQDHDLDQDQDQNPSSEPDPDQDSLTFVLKILVDRWDLPERSGGLSDFQRNSLKMTSAMVDQLPEPFKLSAVAVRLRQLCDQQA